MADAITPRSAGEGADVPVLQNKERLDAGVGSPSFGAAYSSIALTPTALGEMGSQMAISASNTLSKLRGQTLGQNPEGELLPAITNADKAFVESYSTQANATLTLQANKMMQDAQLEIEKSNLLTPESIDAYKKNMSEGMQAIIEHAPSTIKASLANQLASKLLQSSGQLDYKMINQNKQQAKEQDAVYSKQQNEYIYESSRSGDSGAARKTYEDEVAQNKIKRQNGLITATQEEARNHANKISMYTGYYTNGAMEAKRQGKLEAYLSDLAGEPPKGVSFEDWNTVGQEVLRQISEVEALARRNGQLSLSVLNKDAAMGTLTADQLAQAQHNPDISQAEFNNWMASHYARQSTTNSAQSSMNQLMSNFSSSEAHGSANASLVNKSFDALVDQHLQENPDADRFETQVQVAAVSGGQIPKFTRTLNNMAMSGIPEQMQKASIGIRHLAEQNPRVVQSISQQANAILSAFDIASETQDPVTAANYAIAATAPKTKEQELAVQSKWHEYQHKHLSTYNDRVKKANEILHTGGAWIGAFGSGATTLANPSLAAAHVSKALEFYTKALGGDTEAAEEAVKRGFDNVYGKTTVNGELQIAYLSPEKIAGLDHKAGAFVQMDVVAQVLPQLQAYKEAYNAGKIDWYYEVKNTDKYNYPLLQQRIESIIPLQNKIKDIDKSIGGIRKTYATIKNYDDITKNNTKINELYKQKSNTATELRLIKKQLDTIENEHSPIELEKVYPKTNKRETFKMAVVADQQAMLSNNAQYPVAGKYAVTLATEKGIPYQIETLRGFSPTTIGYYPRINNIRQMYANYKNRGIPVVSLDEAVKRHYEELKKHG